MAGRLVWTLALCTLAVVGAAAAPQSPALNSVLPVEAPSLLPSRDFVPASAVAPVAPAGRLHVGFSSSRLPPPRPHALVPMYASFATLQALDYHSTTRALSSGMGREANPLVRPIVNHPPAFIAVKAAATAAIVVATERMWKKHPRQAVVFMAVANSAMAVVVAHNYSVK